MKLSCALSEKDILLSKIHKAMSHAKGMMFSSIPKTMPTSP